MQTSAIASLPTASGHAATGSRPACYGASLQPVSLFQNSFAPPPSAVFVGLNPGAILGPWLVGGDGIDHIGAYWQSADGDQASIDLSGTGPGSITTSLSNLSGWTSGATYRVSFSLAANPDNTLSPQSCVRATTASSQQDYCFNVLNTDGQGTPASTANMGWQRHTFEFTGAPTDHLTFTSLDAPGDGWGPALDNITVEKLVPTTGPGVRQLFTGKERDGETGLDYFGARYLSAAQGRFTSADEPFIDQHAEDPQSWNLYSHVRNNPLIYTDPTGNGCVYLSKGGTDIGSVDDQVSSEQCGKTFGYWVDGTVTEARFAHGSLILSGTTDGQNRTSASYGLGPDPGLMALQLGTQRAAPVVNTLAAVTLGFVAGAGVVAAAPAAAAAPVFIPQMLNFAGKQAAKTAIQSMGLPAVQATAAISAIARATSTSSIQVMRQGQELVVRITRAGANGYQVIESVIDRAGGKRVVQKAFDAADTLVHYDPKK